MMGLDVDYTGGLFGSMKFYEKMRNQFGYTDRKQFSRELWQHIGRVCNSCPYKDKPVCRIVHENRNTKCQCGREIWNVYSVSGRLNLEDLGSECLRAVACYRVQIGLNTFLPI